MKTLLLIGFLVATRAAAAGQSAQAEKATEVARWHFAEGAKAYREARYPEAITHFQAAYSARPSGLLHYNIAQCYERLGEVAKAVESYRAYLREVPGAADRDRIEKVISNLTARLADGSATTGEASKAPAGTTAEPGGLAAAEPIRAPSSALSAGPSPGVPLVRPRLLVPALLGGAVTALAAAVTSGVLAQNAGRQLRSLPGDQSAQTATDLRNEVVADSRAANGLYVVAGVLGAGAGALFLVAGRF